DLYDARHDPEAIDRRLEEAAGDRRRARLVAVCSHLLAETPLRELEEVVRASVARACEAQPPGRAPDAVAAAHIRPERVRRLRRRALLVRSLAAIVVVAAASALIPMLASGHHRPIRALGPPRPEVSGGVAHTWSDPRLANGRAGPEIMPGQTVLIACRLRGFKVQDGNVWWYLLASPPWSHRFCATADTFYND